MDENKGLLAGGVVLGFLFFFVKKSHKGLSVKELDHILELSLENEGPWEAEDAHTRKDKGNYYQGKGIYLGTSWGITADFLAFWKKTSVFKKDDIKNISKAAAKLIIADTVMRNARIAEISDKWVAGLFFDWMWQRPSTCLEYIGKNIMSYPSSEIEKVRNGFFGKGLTDTFIKDLNQKLAGKAMHDQIKHWRLHHLKNTNVYASFREGVRARINRYEYGK